MTKYLLYVALIGLMVLGTCDCKGQSRPQRLLRVSDGAEVSLLEALEDLKQARLILVGEFHDNAKHHAAQLEIIRALQEGGSHLAIGLEMFRKDSQKVLDQWYSGTLSEESFLPAYYDNWNLPWPLYRNIFQFAREHKIPMVGLNIPREITRQVAEQGFNSLTPEQTGNLPPVACVVDKTYREFIRRALGAHGHQSMNFEYFCEAQLVWDTAMAWNLVEYIQQNQNRTVVVLAGSGHAWKQGIPRQIESRSALAIRVILPEVSGRAERQTITEKDADYLWLFDDGSP